MAPHRAISRGRGFGRGARWLRVEEAPTQLKMVVVAYSRPPIDRHNYFSHDGTHDPKVSHVFDRNVHLFLEGFVNEDAPVNEVVVVSITFGNELVKNDAQYIDGDARFLDWIKSTDISDKESIPLDDEEEQVDYGHDNTDAYLTEPDDIGDIGNIGSSLYMPGTFNQSCVVAPLLARLKAAQHQKKDIELNLAELTKKWDSQVVELQAKTKRLFVIRSQAALINSRILKEKAQKGVHEVRDSRMAKYIYTDTHFLSTFPVKTFCN
ncbi:uncharacterized protein A4U43_C08F22950 [Asparagus officinalis]|nr:uncharacterized protein A4U43_C08F22950 [Asparagus officinalis]